MIEKKYIDLIDYDYSDDTLDNLDELIDYVINEFEFCDTLNNLFLYTVEEFTPCCVGEIMMNVINITEYIERIILTRGLIDNCFTKTVSFAYFDYLYHQLILNTEEIVTNLTIREINSIQRTTNNDTYILAINTLSTEDVLSFLEDEYIEVNITFEDIQELALDIIEDRILYLKETLAEFDL